MSYRYNEVKANVDPELKARAYALLEQNNVSPSDFIRTALIELVEKGALPFEIKKRKPGHRYELQLAALA